MPETKTIPKVQTQSRSEANMISQEAKAQRHQ